MNCVKALGRNKPFIPTPLCEVDQRCGKCRSTLKKVCWTDEKLLNTRRISSPNSNFECGGLLGKFGLVAGRVPPRQDGRDLNSCLPVISCVHWLYGYQIKRFESNNGCGVVQAFPGGACCWRNEEKNELARGRTYDICHTKQMRYYCTTTHDEHGHPRCQLKHVIMRFFFTTYGLFRCYVDRFIHKPPLVDNNKKREDELSTVIKREQNGRLQ